MTRNQLLSGYAANLSGGVIFTVDGSGNISPPATQTVTAARGDTISIQMDPALETSVTHVCARQNDVCQCSNLVAGVSSGDHMAINHENGYVVNASVAVDSDYELYAMTDEGPVTSATNGDLHVGG